MTEIENIVDEFKLFDTYMFEDLSLTEIWEMKAQSFLFIWRTFDYIDNKNLPNPNPHYDRKSFLDICSTFRKVKELVKESELKVYFIPKVYRKNDLSKNLKSLSVVTHDNQLIGTFDQTFTQSNIY